MSTTDLYQYTIPQQTLRISSDLNSTLIIQFLFGVYTGVFFVSLFIYLQRGNRTASKDRVVIGSMTALYVLSAINVPINWYYTNLLICTRGTTRFNMFEESMTGTLPTAIRILSETSRFGGFILADGLLVWRCYHACGRSLRGLVLPVAYRPSEVLVICNTVFACLTDLEARFDTAQWHPIEARLTAAMYTAVALTSLVSTFIICREIYVRAKRLSLPGSRTRYWRVIDVLIQSSGAYTALVLPEAIMNFVDTGGDSSTVFTESVIFLYLDAILPFVSGLAPTLMVARLFLGFNENHSDEISYAELPSHFIPGSPLSTITDGDCCKVDIEKQSSGTGGDGRSTSSRGLNSEDT
ncbi:hypothetical protein CPC08DRAFT_762941 [Agrocybe pediades]|nr:hypothetical protein CPC08DRAFT_762941 [Agrocybe pediades]